MMEGVLTMSSESSTEKNLAPSRYALDFEKVRGFLPHRYPFLLIDRVLEIEPKGDLLDLSPATKLGVRVVAQKSVSANEPFFQGHFPERAVMPGVLLLEAMAQTACFTLYPYYEADAANFSKGFSTVLIGADNVRFRRPVVPGDTLRLESVLEKARSKLWSFQCRVTADGEKVAEAEILAVFEKISSPGGAA